MKSSFLPGSQQIGVKYRHKTLGLDGFVPNFHSHVEYEIYYFHGGKCRYFIHDKIYDLKPGDLIVMHGLTLHKPNPDLSIPYERTKIHFKPDYIVKWVHSFTTVNLFLPFEKLKNAKVNFKKREKELDRLFRCAESCYPNRSESLYDTRLRILLLELLTLIYEECVEQTVQYCKSSNYKVANTQKIIDYVEEHFTENQLNLEQIARETFLSKYYVSRTFKEVTGAGIADYISIKKVNLAKQLLLQGKSVTEVSFEVGFKHPAHFSRIFKQKVGVTADAYRKSNHNIQRELYS